MQCMSVCAYSRLPCANTLFCHLQNRNYGSLRTLYQKYRDSGFNLIAFPCNQFGGQAPRTSEGEREFAYKKFGFEFPIMVRPGFSCSTLPASRLRRIAMMHKYAQCQGQDIFAA